MADKNDIRFTLKTEWGEALQEWYGRLAENRGDRAALRKCKSPIQVVFIPAYHELYRDITTVGKAATEAKTVSWEWNALERRIRERLPMIASLTALVNAPENSDSRNETGRRLMTLPSQMGTTRSSGGGPVVSDLRFRRLLKCQTPEDLYPALRRVIGLLDNKTDIMSLAQSIFYWSENMRKEWAYAYYATESSETE